MREGIMNSTAWFDNFKIRIRGIAEPMHDDNLEP
jgi:hypothetical protein